MASSLLHIVDASIPPASARDLPAGTDGVLGYIGGRTPHVWTLPEWDRFSHLLQMPIWVVDFNSNPVTEAKQAADAARALGWFGHDVRGLMLDAEATADGGFLGEMGLKLREDGYAPIGYESTGVLNANPRLDGVVLANPNGVPTVPAGQLVIGHQYAWNVKAGSTVVDLDVFDSSVAHLFGRGARK